MIAVWCCRVTKTATPDACLLEMLEVFEVFPQLPRKHARSCSADNLLPAEACCCSNLLEHLECWSDHSCMCIPHSRVHELLRLEMTSWIESNCSPLPGEPTGIISGCIHNTHLCTDQKPHHRLWKCLNLKRNLTKTRSGVLTQKNESQLSAAILFFEAVHSWKQNRL